MEIIENTAQAQWLSMCRFSNILDRCCEAASKFIRKASVRELGISCLCARPCVSFVHALRSHFGSSRLHLAPSRCRDCSSWVLLCGGVEDEQEETSSCRSQTSRNEQEKASSGRIRGQRTERQTKPAACGKSEKRVPPRRWRPS